MSLFSDFWNDATGETERRRQEELRNQQQREFNTQETARQEAARQAQIAADQQAQQTQTQQAAAAQLAQQQAQAQAEAQAQADAQARAQALAQQQAQQAQQAQQSQMDAAAQAQAQAQAQQAQAQAQAEAQTAARNQSIGAGRTGINAYDNARGADPNQYVSDIDAAIAQALSGVPPTETNVSPYLANLGAETYGRSQDLYRARANSQLDQYFGPNFANTRIADTADDQAIAGLLGEQRSQADQYINNLLRRGVITDVGAGSARRGLEDQSAGARTQLNSIGSDLLAGGRQSLQNINERARGDASRLNLGTAFNAQQYGSEADQAFNEFVGSLGDRLRSSAPTQLFDTRGLAAVAGAGQGPQNLNFDPQALIGGDTEGEAPALGKSVAKKVGQGRFVF